MNLAALFDYAWLVPLLPFLAAAVIVPRILAGEAVGDAAEPLTARFVTGSVGLSGLLLLGLDLAAWQFGAPGYRHYAEWFGSGDVRIDLALMLDPLALAVATVVAFLAWVTLKFAVNYLHREPGFHRFFLVMGLFTTGMLLIVLAGNAVLAFVGWELAGVSSYLLIGYAYDRHTATVNAQRVFVTNRIGDAGFLLAIGMAAIWLGGVDWPTIDDAGHLEPLLAGLLALGFVLAALVKSAQVPFAPWIARALEGPTPSSAIFYGAVMVHAGVYLLLRIEPLLRQAPTVLAVVAAVGLLTALYGALAGRVQTDVKSTLIFATTTQVGLMCLWIGLGLFDLAAWHLALHALWRGWQFLASPSYMHLVSGPAPAPAAWLARCPRLYSAALQRFWLEGMGEKLLVQPTEALARDVRHFDDSVVARLAGHPEDAIAAHASDELPGAQAIIRGHGVAGTFTVWLAGHLQRFETHLILRSGGGVTSRLLHQLGRALQSIEDLLEQPRYLLLLVMATLVVIL